MKSAYLVLMVLTSFILLSAQDGKNTIALLDLDPTGIAPADAQFLTDRLRTELFETGVFQVVERDKMNAILSEQGFQQTGCTSVECAVEIGQLLNVRKIVAGSIGKIENIYSISLRMIDVQTGAITKTATRDYKGRLSEVLTDVIPELAASLAKGEEKAAVPRVDIQEKKIRGVSVTGRKWGLALKGGWAFLSYTSDANGAIDDYSYPEKIDGKYSNHNHIGFEVGYFLSERWQVRLGLGVENILSEWKNERYFEEHLGFSAQYKKMHQFVNPYVGIYYYLMPQPGKYDWYLGGDIGSMGLNVNTSYDLFGIGDVMEDEYTYNAVCIKFQTGFGYFIGQSFRIGLELALQLTGAYDLSDQDIVGLDFSDDPTFRDDILLWKEITASGVQLNFTLNYFF